MKAMLSYVIERFQHAESVEESIGQVKGLLLCRGFSRMKHGLFEPMIVTPAELMERR